jgi:hypothetical protein
MTALATYMRDGASKRWKPGVHDCSAWPARWAGVPLPPYSSDDEAQALIDEAGGLVPLWRRCIDETLAETAEPRMGDIGIIYAASPDGGAVEIGAICAGERWAFITPRGLVVRPAPPVLAWSVPCPRC